MTTDQIKAVVLRFNREFLEKNNVEVLKELVADNFVNHTAAPGVAKDVSGLIHYIGMLHQGFPDLRIEIHEMIAEGDLVATRKTFHATHLGEIMGHAPTGKKVTFNVMDFVRVKDGQYVEHWGRNDVMQVIQQL